MSFLENDEIDLMYKQKENQHKISYIPISAITIEKINSNLLKASKIHDEHNLRAWAEASKHYAAN